MDKLSSPEAIVFMSVLPILFMIFIEHDEMFLLCLVELGFLLIVGLSYAAIVIFVMKIFNKIKGNIDD